MTLLSRSIVWTIKFYSLPLHGSVEVNEQPSWCLGAWLMNRRNAKAFHQLLVTSTLHLANVFYSDFNGREEFSLEP